MAEDEEDLDGELVEIGSVDDEDIADDEFFQEYVSPTAEGQAALAETPAQSEDEVEPAQETGLSSSVSA